MSTQLSPRSKRHRSRKAEFKHQLIVFRLRQEWFALPIQAAQKVIPLGDIYGGGAGAEMGLTLHHGREIPVLDIQQRIFGTGGGTASGTVSQPLLPPSKPSSPEPAEGMTDPLLPERFLLIVQTASETTIGFPLDSQPMLRRVSESAFAPLSAAYLNEGQLRCVRCLIISGPDEPPFFLLNLDQLLQVKPMLPEPRNP
ncbi:chemotaxis protein CheW [Stenomitos frigidus]|uniref:Chemotaxis protein CheW n=1 Tax=Stenomitos frigidus ULC18 TaxID=2107698 RepID=A0A2T1ECG4_9CYAN|nr:chemotaxis protein CheW [Stenomitos frigidus]PSB30420.1 chemotaxis protein CheW [Stenomitos frigidus ULC18]